MTNSQAHLPLPENETGLALLKNLKMRAGDTLYGMALSSSEGDDNATRILTRHIIWQQENNRVNPPATPAKTLSDRSALAEKYATDKTVPACLRELFAEAVYMTKEIAAQYDGQLALASPDTHHFVATVNPEGTGFDINPTTLAHLPPTLHFATLLMNPVNPVQPAVNDMSNRTVELPLEDGRMDRQADIIVEETGFSKGEILKGALVNAMHIAAWRYGKPLAQGQVGIDYFLQVARAANTISHTQWHDGLFVESLKAVQPQ